MLAMVVALVVALVFDGVGHRTTSPSRTVVTTVASRSFTYKPRTKAFIVTTVPLLVHEQAGQFDYLAKDFSKRGVLAGKEVWGFSPSTLTLYQGDTADITIVNPSGDDHTFTVPDLNKSVYVKALSTGHLVVTAINPGVHSFECAMEEHMPFMWGQLVVLPASDAA